MLLLNTLAETRETVNEAASPSCIFLSWTEIEILSVFNFMSTPAQTADINFTLVEVVDKLYYLGSIFSNCSSELETNCCLQLAAEHTLDSHRCDE